jgi:uncharacterized membrane protein YhaH (DUF805 family)
MYNGILIQSYLFLFLNVVIFTTLKSFVLNFVFPLFSRLNCLLEKENVKNETDPVTLNPVVGLSGSGVCLETTSKVVELKGKREDVPVKNTDRTIFEERRRCDCSLPCSCCYWTRNWSCWYWSCWCCEDRINDLLTWLSAIRRLKSAKFSYNCWFLIFQVIVSTATVAAGLFYLEPDSSGWSNYTNYYGFLCNASPLTSFLSFILLAKDRYTEKYSFEAQNVTPEQLENDQRILPLVSVFALLPLLPPFITHVIPGCFVYSFVLLIFLIVVSTCCCFPYCLYANAVYDDNRDLYSTSAAYHGEEYMDKIRRNAVLHNHVKQVIEEIIIRLLVVLKILSLSLTL